MSERLPRLQMALGWRSSAAALHPRVHRVPCGCIAWTTDISLDFSGIFLAPASYMQSTSTDTHMIMLLLSVGVQLMARSADMLLASGHSYRHDVGTLLWLKHHGV